MSGCGHPVHDRFKALPFDSYLFFSSHVFRTFQNKCTQPEDVKLCTWILRPASAGPQRKKVVSFLLQQHGRTPVAYRPTHFPSSLHPSLHPSLCLSLSPSDPGEGGRGPPAGSGARSVPAPDGADPGCPSSLPACSTPCTSSCPPAASSCSSDLLRTSPHLAGHLGGTGTSTPRGCGALDAHAPPTHPGGRHEGPRRMERAQRRPG